GRRTTPCTVKQLELAATASPASTGGSAPGRAFGARRFPEAYFVAVASDSNWQFGLARKTSRRDWHEVRLSKVPGVTALALEWPSAARTVARLARRGQVLSLSAVKLPAGRVSPEEILACVFGETDDPPSDSVEPSPAPKAQRESRFVSLRHRFSI